jgi:hypothetical protein
MIFGNDRNELRRMYHAAWLKRRESQPASALEVQIADIVELHPEYHAVIESGDVGRDFTPDGGESNPYLHMGLHLGLREQVATDRPAGIRSVHDQLAARIGDLHATEHLMIECLAETLWEAQRDNAAPDELRYLERLRQL